MEFLYGLIVSTYGFFLKIAATFHPKAAEWIKGRKNWEITVSKSLQPGEKRIWFHCSSLGEYEQGRPVLERLRNEYKNYKIVLTFFSPSGYLQKKNDSLADYVFYLPLDGKESSKAFVEMVSPEFAVFVKYEFWHFYIKTLKDKRIPSFVISAIFRPSQIYFKNYGKFFYMILQRITHLFVQNQQSLELLYDNKLPNVTVSGDTRFDRVYANSIQAREIRFITEFKSDKPLFIAGSTWPQDEKVLLPLIESYKGKMKFIIVPHEIDLGAIQRFCKHLQVSSVLYSQLNEQTSNADVLVIDNIGMLSALYRYADFAYIGGGFGSGIHNTLEAAVFGIPVFFGPKYKKFREAVQLTELQVAYPVNSSKELITKLEALIANDRAKEEINVKSRRFMDTSRGATEVILSYLKMNYPPSAV